MRQTQDYHVIDITLKTILVFLVIADRKPRPLSRNDDLTDVF